MFCCKVLTKDDVNDMVQAIRKDSRYLRNNNKLSWKEALELDKRIKTIFDIITNMSDCTEIYSQLIDLKKVIWTTVTAPTQMSLIRYEVDKLAKEMGVGLRGGGVP